MENREGQQFKGSYIPQELLKEIQRLSNRLTIGIKVKYTNTKDDKYDFSSTFSNYADYSTDADFDSIEESLIIEILDKIIDDIYNKALVNW